MKTALWIYFFLNVLGLAFVIYVIIATYWYDLWRWFLNAVYDAFFWLRYTRPDWRYIFTEVLTYVALTLFMLAVWVLLNLTEQ